MERADFVDKDSIMDTKKIQIIASAMKFYCRFNRHGERDKKQITEHHQMSVHSTERKNVGVCCAMKKRSKQESVVYP